MLSRLRPGLPEDPQHTQQAVLAMTRAGYEPHEAGRAFVRYRAQVRAAIAAWPSIAVAGVLSGALPGLLMFFAQAGAIFVLTGAAGLGLAVIERVRWREENAHQRFQSHPSGRRYLVHQLLLWVMLLAALALMQAAQAGAVVGLGIAFGLPISLVFRWYFYRAYPLALAVASNAPAGAHARRIVEREAAARAEAPRGPRPVEGPPPAAQGPPASVRGSGTMVSGGSRPRIGLRTAGVFLASLAAWWLLVRWWVWIETPEAPFLLFGGDLGQLVLGLGVGAPVAFGTAWLSRSFIE